MLNCFFLYFKFLYCVSYWACLDNNIHFVILSAALSGLDNIYKNFSGNIYYGERSIDLLWTSLATQLFRSFRVK